MIKESLTLLKLQDFVWLLGFFLVITFRLLFSNYSNNCSTFKYKV